jgi:putative NADPH-quinone reductase
MPPPASATLVGQLNKKGSSWPRSWQSRFFEYDATAGLLSYWTNSDRQKLRGSDLRVLAASPSGGEDAGSAGAAGAVNAIATQFDVYLDGKADPMRLEAESVEEMTRWVDFIRASGASIPVTSAQLAAVGTGQRAGKAKRMSMAIRSRMSGGSSQLGAAAAVDAIDGGEQEELRRRANSLGREGGSDDTTAVAAAKRPPVRRVLVVCAHPNTGRSTNHALAAEAARWLGEKGVEVRSVDLCAENFDPVLRRSDFAAAEKEESKETKDGDAAATPPAAAAGGAAAPAGALSGWSAAKTMHVHSEDDPDFFDYQMQQKKTAMALEAGEGAYSPALEEHMQHLLWADCVIFQFPLYWFGVPAVLSGWLDKVLAYGRFYGGGLAPLAGKRWLTSVTTGAPAAAYGEDGNYHYSIPDLLAGFNLLTPSLLQMETLPLFACNEGKSFKTTRVYMLAKLRAHLLAHVIEEPCSATRAWDAHTRAFAKGDAAGMAAQHGADTELLIYDFAAGRLIRARGSDAVRDGYSALLKLLPDTSALRTEMSELQGTPDSMHLFVWECPTSDVECAAEQMWFSDDGSRITRHAITLWGSCCRRFPKEFNGAPTTNGGSPFELVPVGAAVPDAVRRGWSAFDMAFGSAQLEQIVRLYRGDAQLMTFDKKDAKSTIATGAAGVRLVHTKMIEIRKDRSKMRTSLVALHADGAGGGSAFFAWHCPSSGLDVVIGNLLFDAKGMIVKHNIIIDAKHPVQCAWNSHFVGFFSQDIGRIMRDYTPETNLVSYDMEFDGEQQFYGKDGVRRFFESLWQRQTKFSETLAVPVIDVNEERGSALFIWRTAEVDLASVTFFLDARGNKQQHFAAIWSDKERPDALPASNTAPTGGPAQASWDRHKAAFGAHDLDAVAATFAADSKILVYDHVLQKKSMYHGPPGARDFYAYLLQQLGGGGALTENCTKVFEPNAGVGGTVFFVWSCPDAGLLSCNNTCLLDSDHKIAVMHVVIKNTWSKKRAYTNFVDHDLLTVHRHGSDAEDRAFMDADDQIATIFPGKAYRILASTLPEQPDVSKVRLLSLPTASEPPYLPLPNNWGTETVDEGSEGNILGGNVQFTTEEAVYMIPHGHDTAAEIAWFGAYLLPLGTELIFDTPKAVPCWTMTIGDRYVEDYLLDGEKGGGFYMEHHDCPHLHVPMNKDSSGFIILGKKTMDEKYLMVSAFHIPFGKGLYMPPGTIHCDAFLTGRYMCAYTNAPNFSTAIFRSVKGEVTQMKIWCQKKCKVYDLANDEKMGKFMNWGEGNEGGAEQTQVSDF